VTSISSTRFSGIRTTFRAGAATDGTTRASIPASTAALPIRWVCRTGVNAVKGVSTPRPRRMSSSSNSMNSAVSVISTSVSG